MDGGPHLEDWIVDELVPDNEYIFGIHQRPNYNCCNFITSEILAEAIQKIEQRDRNGVVIRNPFPIEGLTKRHFEKYDRYIYCLSHSYKCSDCGKQQTVKYKCTVVNCKEGCKYKICMKCAATNVVKAWGSRKQSSNDKYVKGIMQCKLCKMAGRIIIQRANMCLTYYRGLTK
jgi:ribosomal protein L40E